MVFPLPQLQLLSLLFIIWHRRYLLIFTVVRVLVLLFLSCVAIHYHFFVTLVLSISVNLWLSHTMHDPPRAFKPDRILIHRALHVDSYK